MEEIPPRDYYDPLPEDQFRLVQLRPSAGLTDSLVADLQVVEFDEIGQRHPKYIALSYGHEYQQLSRPLILNGVPTQITVNLDLALRTLRSSDCVVTIWVDALCINPRDAAEKSRYISLRSQIFRYAIHVEIHLGETTINEGVFSTRLEMLRNSTPFPPTDKEDQMWQNIRTTLGKFESTTYNTVLSSNEESRCVVALLMALCQPRLLDRLKTTKLFSPPHQEEPRYLNKQRLLFEWLRVFSVASWWNRTSITQEVSAARALYFVYRRHRISLGLLQGLLEMDPMIELFLVAENQKVLRLLHNRVQSICQLRDLQWYQKYPDIMKLDYFEKSLGSPLLWLLRTFRNHGFAPRDAIQSMSHSLIRLTNDSGLTLFEPDERISTATLLSRVVVYLIQSTGLFFLTSMDLKTKGTNKRQDRPSWAPNWVGGFPDHNDLTRFLWAVRLCHNVSNVRFRVNAPTEASPVLLLHPRHYFYSISRPQDPKSYSLEIRGPNTSEHSYPIDYSSVVAESFPAATPIYQKSFYLDFKKPAERLFQYEWHALSAQGCKGFKNYLTVPVQFCATIQYVSKPIESDLRNLIDIMDDMEKARKTLFPNEWRRGMGYEEKLVRVLCFGAVFNTRNNVGLFRQLDSLDDNDLVILFYLLSKYSDDELQSFSYLKHHYTSKHSRELHRQCPAYSKDHRPCADCVTRAEMSAAEVSSEFLWQDYAITAIYDTLRLTAAGLSLCLTDQGLAIGPSWTKVNDRVYIISGGLCPYLLRPDTKTNLSYGAFELIGDCYIDKPPAWNIKELQSVTLV
jgi:hypothetical protein